jgi:predicted DNA-binding protein YlxM (UPF0122 family)
MLYSDFLNTLATNNISLKEIAPILGYSRYSISNNWKKDEDIPKRALISLNLYLELKKEKEKNINLKKQLDLSKNSKNINLKNIPTEVVDIANKKCLKTNISLENYISSLIMAHI